MITVFSVPVPFDDPVSENLPVESLYRQPECHLFVNKLSSPLSISSRSLSLSHEATCRGQLCLQRQSLARRQFHRRTLAESEPIQDLSATSKVSIHSSKGRSTRYQYKREQGTCSWVKYFPFMLWKVSAAARRLVRLPKYTPICGKIYFNEAPHIIDRRNKREGRDLPPS
jgi:hypothetical protein